MQERETQALYRSWARARGADTRAMPKLSDVFEELGLERNVNSMGELRSSQFVIDVRRRRRRAPIASLHHARARRMPRTFSREPRASHARAASTSADERAPPVARLTNRMASPGVSDAATRAERGPHDREAARARARVHGVRARALDPLHVRGTTRSHEGTTVGRAVWTSGLRASETRGCSVIVDRLALPHIAARRFCRCQPSSNRGSRAMR